MGDLVQLSKINNTSKNNVVMDWLDQFKSEDTIRGYKYGVEDFFGCNIENISEWKIKGIKFSDVQKYIEGLFDEEKSDNTIRLRKSALSSLFEYCIDAEIVSENPCNHRRINKLIKLRETEGKYEGKSISKEQIGILLGEIDNKKEHLIVGLMFKTGVRVSELIDICGEDIEYRDGYWLRVLGKGSKVRYICLKDELVEEIMEYMEDRRIGEEEKLFNIGTRQVDRVLKKWSGELGLSCHDCRRSFAMNFIKNGGLLTDLQRLLGHSKLETTRGYLVEFNVFDSSVGDVIDW
jgi:site-specific recombinase XerD